MNFTEKVSDFEFRSSNVKRDIFYYRNEAIEIKCDLEKRLENPFMLSKKFFNFNFNELIYIFKQNLQYDENNLESYQIEPCLNFIIEKINPLVSMEIRHQIGPELIGPDDKYPIITNVFAGCFIGKNKINISLFGYIEDYITELTYFGNNKELNTNYQIYLYIKHLAYLAYNWLDNKSYIDTKKNNPIFENNLKLKISILGNCNSGKTSFLHKYIDPDYNISNTQTTLGLDIVKSVNKIQLFDKNFKINVQFWDTVGLEKYNAIATNQIEKMDGILYLFDLGTKRFQTYLMRELENEVYDLGNLIKTYQVKNLRFKNNISDKPILYFGNKTDLINTKYFDDKNHEFLKKFLKINFKYNQLVNEWCKNKNLDSMNKDTLIKYIKLIINSGNNDIHYWGSVFSNQKIRETIIHTITNVSLSLLNNFDNDDDTIQIRKSTNIKKYKYDMNCCKIS